MLPQGAATTAVNRKKALVIPVFCLPTSSAPSWHAVPLFLVYVFICVGSDAVHVPLVARVHTHVFWVDTVCPFHVQVEFKYKYILVDQRPEPSTAPCTHGGGTPTKGKNRGANFKRTVLPLCSTTGVTPCDMAAKRFHPTKMSRIHGYKCDCTRTTIYLCWNAYPGSIRGKTQPDLRFSPKCVIDSAIPESFGSVFDLYK